MPMLAHGNTTVAKLDSSSDQADVVDSVKDFHHPYQPYDIQVNFMNALYNRIEHGQVGIFESPTGTSRIVTCLRCQVELTSYKARYGRLSLFHPLAPFRPGSNLRRALPFHKSFVSNVKNLHHVIYRTTTMELTRI